jgi:hypothetical protein
MPLLLLHRALQRILGLASQFFDGSHLGLCDFERVNAGYSHAILVHMEHDPGRFGVRLVKDRLQHLDHELHRRVVVIQQDDLVERGLGGFGPGLGPPFGDSATLPAVVVIAVAARDLGKRGPAIFALAVHRPCSGNEDSRSAAIKETGKKRPRTP